MSSNSTHAEISKINLKALKLRPGMALQIQRSLPGAPNNEAQFLAAIEGKGIMVGPHGAVGGKIGMQPGEDYLVRGFTGQYDFSFASNVIQIYEKPFAYALLSYPGDVEARMVRSAMRMKTSLPATVSLPGGSSFIAVSLVDVSVAGAMIKSPTSLGIVGDQLNLSFSMDFEKNKVNLVLLSAICHSNKSEPGDGFNVGLIFKGTTQNDKLVLHYITQDSSE